MAMPGVADILRRMADDLDFARAVESDPVNALRGIDLSILDLRRIEEAVAAVHGTQPALTPSPESQPSTTPAAPYASPSANPHPPTIPSHP